MPDGPLWAHEIKHDGYRMICGRDGDRVRVFTRRGHDWTDRVPAIAEAARFGDFGTCILRVTRYFVDLEIISSGKVVDQRLGNERGSWPELFTRRRPTAFG